MNNDETNTRFSKEIYKNLNHKNIIKLKRELLR